ncbi:MAG: adenylate/guanylate cyclase domain-containing protein [Burkholderiales bacterium]|nr:adenylate/guanylate cyclase domain-containing protein [Burkholderiales bacterium]
MPASPLKRKLSAILAADAVSYSRKMSRNEEGTMRVLSAHRAVIDGIIEFHDGRIANTAGDSVLAEFASPVEAVRCAVEIQDALRTRNDSLPEEQRLEFRVGVNLGDVMVKGADLLGDGVNVAARLESIAEPGGICISSSIYDLIRGKLDLGFVDIGEQSLKNIEHPIRVYRVDRDGMRPADSGGGRKAPRMRVVGTVAATAAVALLAAAWGWNLLPQMPWEAERQRQAAAEAERRGRIAADLERARAAVEAAQSKAEAEAAAAADARRALEAQRAAASKAAAAAELARVRAEAEAARHKAEADLNAAKQALERAERERLAAAKLQQPSPAASRVPGAPLPLAQEATASPDGGRWSASLHCDPWRAVGAVNFPLRSSFGSAGFELVRGYPEAPGYVLLRGVPTPDGRLVLTGNGRAGKQSKQPGMPYEAQFTGVLQAGTYEGRGALGERPCIIRMSRVQ